MKGAFAAFLVAASIAFQALALPLYRSGTAAPDFPFLVLSYLAFFAPPRRVLALGALAAAAMDTLSLDPLGTRLLGYLPAIWLVGRARRSFIVESAVFRAGLTFLACCLALALEGGYVSAREGAGGLGLGWALWAALYTALLGVSAHAALDLVRPQLGWARDRFFS